MINAIGNMIGVRRGGGGSSLDPNAAALLAAMDAGGDVLPDPDRLLINDFFVYLKANNLYSKGFAGWLFRGGTASANKWNMFNPVDSDAAFRLTYTGGLTHNANGITPNGSSGYFNTHFIPSSHFIFPNGCMVIYCRSLHSGGYGPIYCENGGGQGVVFLTGTGSPIMTLNGTAFQVTAGGGVTGVLAVDYNHADGQAIYRDGAAIASNPAQNTVVFPFKVRVGVYFNGDSPGGAGEFNGANIAFLGFFDHLTAAEHLTLYNGIAALQTGFGR